LLAADLVTEIIARLDAGTPASDLRAQLNQYRSLLNRPIPPPEMPGPRRTRGRSFYDTLVAEMLALVRSAGSREALLDLVMSRLAEESDQRVGLGYLLISGVPHRSSEGLASVKIERTSGFQPERAAAFQAAAPPRLAGSRLVDALISDTENLDFLPLELIRDFLYDGEFDGLYDRPAGAWLAAVALPALDARQPNRALIGLFRSAGSRDQPALPRGAAQEWRSLEFLRVAYDLLNHQLASVAEQREAQRRDLIADLAPGIVQHEINQQLRILQSGSHVMNWAIRDLPDTVAGHPATARLIDALVRQYRVLERLSRVASAFNNLGKRNEPGVTAVTSLVAEMTSLLDFRLASNGVTMTTEIQPPELTVETDSGLFEHVLLNLLMNALDAFAAVESPAAGPLPPRSIIVKGHPAQDGGVIVYVMNDGPPITSALHTRLFDKGVSSKPRGAGQGLGLYICKLVMAYLGGTVELMQPVDLPPGITVGFQVAIPRVAPSWSPLADAGSIDDPAIAVQRIRRRAT
jgi:signal transduction histidine kinase